MKILKKLFDIFLAILAYIFIVYLISSASFGIALLLRILIGFAIPNFTIAYFPYLLETYISASLMITFIAFTIYYNFGIIDSVSFLMVTSWWDILPFPFYVDAIIYFVIISYLLYSFWFKRSSTDVLELTLYPVLFLTLVPSFGSVVIIIYQIVLIYRTYFNSKLLDFD